MRRKLTVMVGIVCLWGTASLAQSNEKQAESKFLKNENAKRWSIGLDVGPTVFHGDADDANLGFELGLNAKYNITHTLGLKLRGSFGQLNGGRSDLSTWLDKDWSQNSVGYDYEFQNKFKQISMRTEYTFGNISYLRRDRKLHYVLFLGLGAMWSDTEAGFVDGADIPSYAQGEAEGAHNYKGRNFFLPMGGALRYRVSELMDLGLELQYSVTRTDIIDGFTYPVHPNRTFDGFTSVLLNLGLKIGGEKGQKHVEWINPVQDIYTSMEAIGSHSDKTKDLLADDDDDGVANYFDKEPNTPKGAKTWADGTASDIDRDGVPDHEDKDPFSEPGAEVAADGTMIDRDADGVPDYRDKETNTPKGSSVDRFGKRVEIKGSGGSCCDCSALIYPEIQFSNGSSSIGYSSTAVLFQIAENLRKCPDVQLEISSYTYRNKAASNLASQRTNAIIDYLNSRYSIPRDRFKQKIVDNDPTLARENRNKITFK